MAAHGAWLGLLMALGAGLIIGSVLVPVKLVKKWAWENTWLVFSTCAYLCFPWIVGFLTIPYLWRVYADSGDRTLAGTALLGFGWGLGVVLVGIALDMVGLSISTVLLYGVSVAFGSLFALLLVDLNKALTLSGIEILAWNMVLLAGVALCARGGSLKEPSTSRDRTRLRRGIGLSILAGLLSTLFNLVLVVGTPLEKQAIALGAARNLAPNAIWALAVSAGSLPSLIWCVHLLFRNRTWRNFVGPGFLTNCAWCLAMGAAWISGTVLYGASTLRMGTMGPAVAWPIYLSAVILTGNGWGLALGEWALAPRRALNWLWGGLVCKFSPLHYSARLNE